MFRSKTKRAEELPERSQTPQPTKSKKKFFGRKKDDPEPVPQLDLTAALPSSENFRTSLLMPSLSTRFSMLREQDDPHSMLGKANDDSVLHSHRKSRLGGFSDTGLSDIAEVASISGSIRPPFAANGRSASYTTDASMATLDDDSSTNGSIMSRARPGEGNMLFGGRQKIYKIPVGDAGSVKSLGGQEQRGMKGRALYEDDVHMSSFQKIKEEARRAERERKLEELERDMFNEDIATGALNSPSFSTFDERRGTTSSTGSGPSRMSGSTAATSINTHWPIGSAAQSPMTNGPPQSAPPPSIGRSNSRRLYDSNLDHNVCEQQAANLTRMNSMQRKTSLNGPTSRHYLQGSRSATNLRERFGPPASSESSRAASPLPPIGSEKLTTFDNIRSPMLNGHSPVSPVFNDPENPLTQAMDAKDRGKATALGQFNRPKQFDEQQFLQRQRSLHQQNLQRNDTRSPVPPYGRNVIDARRPSAERKPFFPPPRRPSEEARSRAGSAQSDRPGFIPRPRAGTGRSDGRPSLDTRPRTGTNRNGSSRPSLESRSPNYSGPPSPAGARFNSPEGYSPRMVSPAKSGRQEPFPPQPNNAQPPPLSTRSAHDTNAHNPSPAAAESPLLGRDSPAEASPKISLERGTEDDVPAPLLRGPPQPPQLRDHPALRGTEGTSRPESSFGQSREDRRKAISPELVIGHFVPPKSRDGSEPNHPIGGSDVLPDSPTTKEDSETPNQLDGLIRSHLRGASNASSVYPAPDPDQNRQSVALSHQPSRMSTVINEDVNPWLANGEPGPQTNGTDASHWSADSIGVALPLPSDTNKPQPSVPSGPRPGDADEWMNELRKQHARDLSAETQRERDAFAQDIRSRQRAIQENLRIKNESSVRSPSPGFRDRQHMFEKPFAMLRKSSSREDLSRKKAGLGITSPGSNVNGQARSPPPSNRFQPPSMGRTLHMRMPEGARPSMDSSRGRSTSRPRKASEASMTQRQTPPQSGRTSTSVESSSRRPSDIGGDIRRSDFPAGFQSTHPSARPSLDTMRQRSDSSATTRTLPPIPPLRAVGPTPSRPPIASLSTTTSVPSTTTASPAPSGINTPPLTSTTMSSPDLRGETNTSLAQIPAAGTPPIVPSTLPSSTYTFPPRSDKDRPAAAIRRAGRSPTINKHDISSPTLISSTSNIETVELDEKRQQLQAMAMANTSNSSMPSSPPLSPPMAARSVSSPTRRHFFTRKSDESTQVSGDDSSGQSNLSKKSKSSEEDEFLTRPSGGRMRIRKVSSEDGGLKSTRRFEAVRAGLVEGEANSIAGGMI